MANWGVPWDARFLPPNESVNYAGFNDLSNIDRGIETPNINDVRHWGASTTFDWTLENIGVKLILAHREFDAQWGRDSDASPMPINHTLDTFRRRPGHGRDSRQRPAVRRQAWSGPRAMFYFNADDLNSNISVLYPCLNATACIDRVDTQTTENTGVFVNTVTRPHGQAVADGRAAPHRGRQGDPAGALQSRRASIAADSTRPLRSFANSSETDPMVSVSYQLSDSLMLYATYQEGFRGGGTTARPTATTRVPFGPETLSNFEIGMKSDLLDGRHAPERDRCSTWTTRTCKSARPVRIRIGSPAWITAQRRRGHHPGRRDRAPVDDRRALDARRDDRLTPTSSTSACRHSPTA